MKAARLVERFRARRLPVCPVNECCVSYLHCTGLVFCADHHTHTHTPVPVPDCVTQLDDDNNNNNNKLIYSCPIYGRCRRVYINSQ